MANIALITNNILSDSGTAIKGKTKSKGVNFPSQAQTINVVETPNEALALASSLDAAPQALRESKSRVGFPSFISAPGILPIRAKKVPLRCPLPKVLLLNTV